MNALMEILRGILTGSSVIVAPANTDEPPAARTPDERRAATAEVTRLETEGEVTGIKLRREYERVTAERQAADRAAEEARRAEARARSAFDLHSWGVSVRVSRLRAMLQRGAAPIIDQVIAELDRQWQAERTAGRHIPSLNAPLTAAQIADNARADANLAGLITAQRECEELKLRALSDGELAAALEQIIRRIPSRYPHHETVGVDVKTTVCARPRLAHSAKAVA